jgi:hypothetical protein
MNDLKSSVKNTKKKLTNKFVRKSTKAKKQVGIIKISTLTTIYET